MARRVIEVYLVVSEPDLSQARECPCCRFDALLTFPIAGLSESGVSRWGAISRCVRCWDSGCDCVMRAV